MSGNSDKNKAEVDFLKFENNEKNDYILIKSGKNIYNLPKSQVYSTTHAQTHDYFINAKNNYPSVFGNSFYVDFELPKLDMTYHQILLKFKLQNGATNGGVSVMPSYLMVEKVSLLKNSNALGNDIYDWDIFLHNLHKFSNDYNLISGNFMPSL